jgi:peptidoglycan/LPS O-acetylase OafA/YrhL
MQRPELPALTGVRFYAALLVFLWHAPRIIPGMDSFGSANLFLSTGDMGVAFFFVLSGFVLSYNYAHRFTLGVRSKDYKQFLWARLTKIYPVHLLTLILVLPISLLSPQTPFDWRAVPLHATLLQCLWPWPEPRFSDNLNKVSWSISCEWFFYLLAPIAMLIIIVRRRHWLVLAAIAMYVSGLALFLWDGQSEATRLYFVSRFAPSRLLEFLGGVVIGGVFLSTGRMLESVSRLMQVVGVSLLAVGAIAAPRAPWPLLGGGLLYVPGALLLILGLSSGPGFLVDHLSQRALKVLGTASFSFYMVHHLILRAVRGSCLYFGWTVHSEAAFWSVMALMFVIAQAAAIVVCYAYEIPVQKWLRAHSITQKDVYRMSDQTPVITGRQST